MGSLPLRFPSPRAHDRLGARADGKEGQVAAIETRSTFEDSAAEPADAAPWRTRARWTSRSIVSALAALVLLSPIGWLAAASGSSRTN
jgi:hypothetical protein